ncbi:MAG: heavy-metal-associated domain-containing protein [Allobaculum sp.]|uniref:heavy-metal-associated domain-containing protein n=1 Tax=Allobaculum sp. TaxID=1872463 RepID=UPI00399B7BD0
MVQTVLKVDGMMCGMCESHLADTVRKNFTVKKVTASRRKGTIEILSEKPLDEDQIKSVIGQAGYDLRGIQSHEVKFRRGFFGFRK